MEQLNNLVNQVMVEMTTTGKLEEMIKGKVEAMVDDAMNEAFRSYGSIGKQLRKGIEDKVHLDFDRVNFDEYNIQVVNMINQAASRYFEDAALKKMTEQMDELFSPAPKEVTVQELINPFLEQWREDNFDPDSTATVKLERSKYSWWDLSLWENKEESSGRKYSASPGPLADLELVIHDGGRIGVPRRYKANMGLGNYQADSKIYQMYAAGTVVTDVAECDVYDLDLNLCCGEL